MNALAWAFQAQPGMAESSRERSPKTRSAKAPRKEQAPAVREYAFAHESAQVVCQFWKMQGDVCEGWGVFSVLKQGTHENHRLPCSFPFIPPRKGARKKARPCVFVPLDNFCDWRPEALVSSGAVPIQLLRARPVFCPWFLEVRQACFCLS